MRIFQIIVILLFLDKCIFCTNFPFPQSISYGYGIKPTCKTQQEINNDIQQLFAEYRNRYFSQQGTPQQGMWRVVVKGQYGDDGNYYPNCTVSEAQGYGMLITVVMDNSENNTKPLYDGLFKYYKYYTNSNGLMKWIIDANGIARSEGAATDGDVDVAMSLVLAHYQWGSDGEINYKEEATNLINNIMKHMVDPYYVLRPGDGWGGVMLTRPSDYVTAFFKVFSYFTSNNKWDLVVNNCYNTIYYFYNTYQTGLVADFCKADGTESNTVMENTLSQNPPTDYIYGYNACRVPWRLGIDWLWFGDERAYNVLRKITQWLRQKTNNDVSSIRDGYSLDGNELVSWVSPAFVAPFGVAATVSSEYQEWLDEIYNWLVNRPSSGYYADSIRLLSLLLITGNFPNFMYMKPQVFFLNLSDNSVISGIFKIEVGHILPQGGDLKIEFYFNNELKYTDTTSPFSYELDTTLYKDGIYTIKIKSFLNEEFFDEKEVLVKIRNVIKDEPYVDKNPFIISQHHKCKFYNVSEKGVEIYNISGEMIRKLSSLDGKAEWDGKDNNGVYVNSGIYVYIVDDKIKKIAVIR